MTQGLVVYEHISHHMRSTGWRRSFDHLICSAICTTQYACTPLAHRL